MSNDKPTLDELIAFISERKSVTDQLRHGCELGAADARAMYPWHAAILASLERLKATQGLVQQWADEIEADGNYKLADRMREQAND